MRPHGLAQFTGSSLTSLGRRGLVLLCLAALLPRVQLQGQQARAVWNLSLDNDDFALWRSARARSDRDYSSGVEIALLHPLASSPTSRWTRTAVFAISHRLYTPDINGSDSTRIDRPYAAFLGARVGLQFERPGIWHEIGAGASVTGPPALGRELQTFFHELTGSAEPTGWDRQVQFRLGISATYAGAKRLIGLRSPSMLGLDVAGLWGAELGSFRSAVTVGTRTTLGLRAPRPWARPGQPDETHGARVYLIGGLGLDAVVYDATLRWDDFPDAPKLDNHVLVPRAEAGIGLELGGVSVSWLGVVTGREFTGQPSPHAYGSFRIAIR